MHVCARVSSNDVPRVTAMHHTPRNTRGTRSYSPLAHFSATRHSATQILRGTKVVRSITSTPKRVSGSGSIGGAGVVAGSDHKRTTAEDGGGGKGDEDGIYNKEAPSKNNRSSKVKKSKNRSSIVAHVPAETLCSNPLKPCGACMEWLKKIAEVNPDFKVITFTDSRCGGVYIEDVAQIL